MHLKNQPVPSGGNKLYCMKCPLPSGEVFSIAFEDQSTYQMMLDMNNGALTISTIRDRLQLSLRSPSQWPLGKHYLELFKKLQYDRLFYRLPSKHIYIDFLNEMNTYFAERNKILQGYQNSTGFSLDL